MTDELKPTEALTAFLTAVLADEVVTQYGTNRVRRTRPGQEPDDVSGMAFAAEKAGLVYEPATSPVWALTKHGKAFLAGGAS